MTTYTETELKTWFLKEVAKYPPFQYRAAFESCIPFDVQ